MKLHVILAIGLVLSVTGCGKQEQATSEPAAEAAMTGAVAVTAGNELWRNASFIEHMHLHAQYLDDLNYALEDNDLDAAKSSANWLSTHDSDSDIQSDWLPYLYGMRTAAEAVESAPDLATAQVAAKQITILCQKCHVAVGVKAL